MSCRTFPEGVSISIGRRFPFRIVALLNNTEGGGLKSNKKNKKKLSRRLFPAPVTHVLVRKPPGENARARETLVKLKEKRSTYI